MLQLADRHCRACEGETAPLSPSEVDASVAQLDARWTLDRAAPFIEARFEFKTFAQTSAFVNALIWIAHRENHHPVVSFGYHDCTVRYWTHDSGGLTENDFICAAKVDQLLR